MDIDWGNLGFKFMPTRSNIRFHYADGKWDDGKLTGSYDITLSVAANALHYGQAIFEGGKAFRFALVGAACSSRDFCNPRDEAERMAVFALQLDKAWEFWFLAVCVAGSVA